MCLGGGSNNRPALQQRTLPAEGTRPADESTNKSSGKARYSGRTLDEFHPSAVAQEATKEWEETGTLTESRTIKRNDPGINL